MAERAAAPGQAKFRNKFLILGGGFATNRGMAKMAEPFGPDAVAFNNEFSSDPQNPLRYTQQSRFVQGAVQEGRAVVLPHSLGLQSWGKTQEQLKSEGFFDSGEKAPRLILIAASPVGLTRGFLEKAAFYVNYARVGAPTAKGIDALTAFPSATVTDKQVEGFMGKWRQADPSVTVVSLPRQAAHEELLTDIQKRKLAENDKKLGEAVKKKKTRKVRSAVRQRGRIVGKEIQKIFDGKDRPANEESQDKVSFPRMLKNSREVRRRMFTGQTEKDIRFLIDQGAEVVLVHSIYDRVAPLKASVRLRDELAQEGKEIKVVVFDRFGHSGLALDNLAYADAVKGLLEEGVQPVKKEITSQDIVSQGDTQINPILSFKEASIDHAWGEDTTSSERQDTIEDLVAMLEEPLEKMSELAHLGAYRTEYPYGRGPVMRRRYNTKFVRIGPDNNPDQTQFARRITGDTGPIDTSIIKWEIPRGEGEPPLDIFLQIKGSMRGDLRLEDPHVASIDGEPASRAEIERARNKIGTFFKQEASQHGL